jgi:hypothetical protein
MTKFRITYDAVNGDPTQDGLCGKLVDEFISLGKETGLSDLDYVTSSSAVITAFRLAAAEDKIATDDVVFIFEGQEITMDNNFELSAWPLGFCDPQGAMLSKIMKIRRSDRKELL